MNLSYKPLSLALLSNGQYVCLLEVARTPCFNAVGYVYVIETYTAPAVGKEFVKLIRTKSTIHHADTANARYLQLLRSFRKHGIKYAFLPSMPFRARPSHADQLPLNDRLEADLFPIQITNIDF
jgi:hypothetical protein